MKISQHAKVGTGDWEVLKDEKIDLANLVLVFGDRALLSDGAFESVQALHKKAENIVLVSTSGEIAGTSVTDDGIVVTALEFDSTKVQLSYGSIEKAENTFMKAQSLAQELEAEGLRHVLVFSDGLMVNGSELVRGIKSVVPDHVLVTGGLAGDDADFKKTLVGLNEEPDSGKIVCIGFYGDSIKIGHGSVGGWDTFGSKREVTKSEGNVVFEFDGEPALALYEKYLGEQAKDLPGVGLLFPINVKFPDQDYEVVRTILDIDREAQSITFAGDVPQGSMSQLMKANFNRLVDGAESAAEHSTKLVADPALAILVSCVGRKLILKQRTEEEVEAVQSLLGDGCVQTGFYSYGEIAPILAHKNQCDLHNQTMTITTFSEQ